MPDSSGNPTPSGVRGREDLLKEALELSLRQGELFSQSEAGVKFILGRQQGELRDSKGTEAHFKCSAENSANHKKA